MSYVPRLAKVVNVLVIIRQLKQEAETTRFRIGFVRGPIDPSWYNLIYII